VNERQRAGAGEGIGTARQSQAVANVVRLASLVLTAYGRMRGGTACGTRTSPPPILRSLLLGLIDPTEALPRALRRVPEVVRGRFVLLRDSRARIREMLEDEPMGNVWAAQPAAWRKLGRESAPRAPTSQASRWCVTSARSGQFHSESVT